MSSIDNNTLAFFALLRAGLWEQSTEITSFEPLDFDAIYQYASDQSVVGLIAAGLEWVSDRKIKKSEAVPFLKKVISLELRNSSMNAFIEEFLTCLDKEGIHSLLVKGQGVAQCYSRPQWRSSGDIDLLLDRQNYRRARDFFSRKNVFSEPEGVHNMHQAMKIESWTVELHGTLRCELSSKMDRIIDGIRDDTISKGHVRYWRDGNTDVALPGPDNDIIFIFTHILMHFYKGGIGLRQICDWCRLLWYYRNSIDKSLLESRLRQMHLMTVWKTFAALAVNSLGMPIEAMPLYDPAQKWTGKALRLQQFILDVGNFGKKRDSSYSHEKPYLTRKMISFKIRCRDILNHSIIFPVDSIRYFPNMIWNGLVSAIRGE